MKRKNGKTREAPALEPRQSPLRFQRSRREAALRWVHTEWRTKPRFRRQLVDPAGWWRVDWPCLGFCRVWSVRRPCSINPGFFPAILLSCDRLPLSPFLEDSGPDPGEMTDQSRKPHRPAPAQDTRGHAHRILIRPILAANPTGAHWLTPRDIAALAVFASLNWLRLSTVRSIAVCILLFSDDCCYVCR